MESTPKNLADAAAAICPICGDPVDASQTAVAVIRGDGSPGLVHPACYPQFSAQQREQGNFRYAESPLRDLATPPRAGDSAEAWVAKKTPEIPKAGGRAPDFTATADTGNPLTLSSFRGRWVVLFFYPKDSTPGWTLEATGFRDALSRFERADAVVIGVSPDSVKKHCNFKAKHDLPYTLVADTDHAVAEAYGVWQQKSMFGHKYMGNARMTFLIAPDGRIAHVFEKVTPIGHATEVLAELVRLRG